MDAKALVSSHGQRWREQTFLVGLPFSLAMAIGLVFATSAPAAQAQRSIRFGCDQTHASLITADSLSLPFKIGPSVADSPASLAGVPPTCSPTSSGGQCVSCPPANVSADSHEEEPTSGGFFHRRRELKRSLHQIRREARYSRLIVRQRFRRIRQGHPG